MCGSTDMLLRQRDARKSKSAMPAAKGTGGVGVGLLGLLEGEREAENNKEGLHQGSSNDQERALGIRSAELTEEPAGPKRVTAQVEVARALGASLPTHLTVFTYTKRALKHGDSKGPHFRAPSSSYAPISRGCGGDDSSFFVCY